MNKSILLVISIVIFIVVVLYTWRYTPTVITKYKWPINIKSPLPPPLSKLDIDTSKIVLVHLPDYGRYILGDDIEHLSGNPILISNNKFIVMKSWANIMVYTSVIDASTSPSESPSHKSIGDEISKFFSRNQSNFAGIKKISIYGYHDSHHIFKYISLISYKIDITCYGYSLMTLEDPQILCPSFNMLTYCNAKDPMLTQTMINNHIYTNHSFIRDEKILNEHKQLYHYPA